jgi:rRNA pseudouridine-1189 N-methylase Emg1 (Nep1/Mra1 family)
MGDFLGEVTTIQIEKNILKGLKEVKQHPRQTYSELIGEMTTVFRNCKARENQYDEFLHKIQQSKMKELWDNKEDKAWEKA